MSWEDLRTDTIEIDPECYWVPNGMPFSLLKIINFPDIINDFEDKPEGTFGRGTTATSWPAKTGSGSSRDFNDNNVFGCSVLNSPPVRPELAHESKAVQDRWGQKGLVLKREYFKPEESHTTSYLMQALFIQLSLTFSFRFLTNICDCTISTGVMVLAGGSGTVALATGSCSNLTGPSWDCGTCIDCAEHAGEYSASATVTYESSYRETWIFEPHFNALGVWTSSISKVWDINDVASNVCINGPSGQKCGNISAATVPLPCFCFGNPLAGDHTGLATLQINPAYLEIDWQDGITEDEDGNKYYLGYKIEYPSIWPPTN